jgi:hypothetical protein
MAKPIMSGTCNDDGYMHEVIRILQCLGSAEEAAAVIATRGPDAILRASGDDGPEDHRSVRDFWLDQLAALEPSRHTVRILQLVQEQLGINFAAEAVRPVARWLVWIALCREMTEILPGIVRLCKFSQDEFQAVVKEFTQFRRGRTPLRALTSRL